MLIKYDFTFILTHISTISVIVMTFIILRIKNKSQIQYTFLSIVSLLLFWNLGTLFEIYFRQIYNYTEMIFVNISYLGICFIPVLILLLGIIFAHTKINFSWKYYLLLIIPIISTVIIWTNNNHKYFFVNYSVYSKEAVYGWYYFFHSIYSYLCILIGLTYLGYYSMKNSGFFSKQSLLIFVGIIIPLIINVLYSFNLAELTFSVNSIAFTFSSFCFIFAILKFQFLNVIPVALQKIVDLISDSYIVINEELEIIDYNKTFVDTFSGVITIKRKDKLTDVLSRSSAIDSNELVKYIKKSKDSRKSISFEKHILSDNFDKYFFVEITPIFTQDQYIGTIILLKDITEIKNNINLIQQQHNQLIQSERLASLGQLIGGIAHNLKTPIMSIAGGVEGLKDLIAEYKDSVGDPEVTIEDHHEIAKEMLSWAEKIQTHCGYMSDIISAVKGQAVQMNASSDSSFTLDELVKRVDILMKHELKKHYCKIHQDIQANMDTVLKGEINNLVQILDNLIVNAIHSYDENGGDINLKIRHNGNNIEIVIQDFGRGIPKDVQAKLFKEMITTKGKNGTGLGLYMSYSTIKGKFGGNMWFESEEGKGTTFYITIPCISNISNREVS